MYAHVLTDMVRPNLKEETVEELNEVAGRYMKVDPEAVPIDERLQVVLDQLNTTTQRKKHSEFWRAGRVDRRDTLDAIRSVARRFSGCFKCS